MPASVGMKDSSCSAVWAEYPSNASVLLNLALWIIVSMLFGNVRVAVLALCWLQIFWCSCWIQVHTKILLFIMKTCSWKEKDWHWLLTNITQNTQWLYTLCFICTEIKCVNNVFSFPASYFTNYGLLKLA